MPLRSILLALVLAVAGCESYSEYKYHPATEIREGPGIFTGEDGVWRVDL